MKRKLSGRTLLLIVPVMILAAGGIYYMRGQGTSEIEITPNNLTQYLGRVVQTERYVKGRQNLVEYRKVGEGKKFVSREEFNDFYGSIMTCICVDFLRTLTSEQVAKIGGVNGHLAFAELRPEQQELLMLRESIKHVFSPMSDKYGAKSYEASYSRFLAFHNSCPNLELYFPGEKGINGNPAFLITSIPLNW